MPELNHDRQPGLKVFDANKYKDVEQLKNSGFIPYFKFGKLNTHEVKAGLSQQQV